MSKQNFCAYDEATSAYVTKLDYTKYKPTKLHMKSGGTKSKVKVIRELCICPFCGRTGFANHNLGGILIEHVLVKADESDNLHSTWAVQDCCSRFGTNYETVSGLIYQQLNLCDDIRVANSYGILRKLNWDSYTIEQIYMAVMCNYIKLDQIPLELQKKVKNYFKDLKNEKNQQSNLGNEYL